MENRKILIIEDHQLMVLGIEELIINHIKDVEVFSANNEISAQAFIDHINRIDLIICDLQLHESGKSFNIITKANHLKIPIIVFSTFENPLFIEDCKARGILSYVCKRSGDLELLNAIKSGLLGLSSDCQIVSELLKQEILFPKTTKLSLTTTEKMLVKCWSSGMSNSDIIKRFNYNENTLRTHRRHILFNNNCTFEHLLASFNDYHNHEEIDVRQLLKNSTQN